MKIIDENKITEEIVEKKSTRKKIEIHDFLLFSMLIINIMSIMGYATFSLNPSLLAKFPETVTIFNYSYYFFSRTQIIISFLALAFLFHKKHKYSWVKDFSFVFAISLFLEWLGTSFGIPFGKYEYTDLLGWKILDRVPYLIPVSWFFMSVSSYCISLKLGEKIDFKNKFLRSFFNIIIASVFLTSWDLTLDPAMSNLTPFWIWEKHNSLNYFGTPIVNFWGWFFTAFLIMTGFELIKTERLLDKQDIIWNIKFYFANLSLPVGIVVFSGLYSPVFITLIVFSLMYGFSFLLSKK